MPEEEVLADLRDGVLWLRINRPHRGNALTPANRLFLVEKFAEAEQDLAVRCVVLTGTGRSFCTGADLRASAPAPPRPDGAPARVAGDVARNIRTNAQRMITAIMDCEKPVIAAVNGTAAGLGAHVALACDLVVASRSARFIEVFVRRGLVPDGGGAYLLPRIVGVQRAKELFFLGEDVSAERAEKIGLVNRIAEAEDLDEVVGEIAGRLSRGPTRALALTKWLVNRSLESGRTAAFEDESYAQEINMTTVDGQEGVASFVERRQPEYRGW
jgi:2-(1,2-epoxy-1,2-dihydrophenyl)acetyl-CoA isomerase